MTAWQNAKHKLALEQMGMAPFVWLGKLATIFLPLKGHHRIFLFFQTKILAAHPK